MMGTPNLDAIDRKIITSLLENSRASISSIAKDARVSREVATYRIQQLVRKGIISAFIPVINYALIGYKQYTLFLEIVNDAESNDAITKKLITDKRISWVGSIIGQWTHTCDIIVKTKKELNEVLQSIRKTAKGKITREQLLIVKNQAYFFHKYVSNEQKKFFLVTPKINLKSKSTIKIDQTDTKILEMLSINSRVSLIDIAKEILLTANGAKQRLRRLKKTGIICGFTISLNHTKLGYNWYGFQLKFLPNANRDKIKAFFAYAKPVLFAYEYDNAQYDFDIGISARSIIDVNAFMQDCRKHFASDIRIVGTFIVNEELTPPTIKKL